MRYLPILLLVVAATGCSTRQRTPPGQTCRDASDCTVEAGQLAACLSNTCQAVDCLSSTDCGLGSWCSVETGDYSCVPGCQLDSDCQAGERCSEEGSCQAYGCRDTNLDCEIGEICNAESGACEPASGLHCALCDGGDWQFADQGTLDPCDDVWTGHSGCGGEDAQCRGYDQGGDSYCMLPCGTGDSCPRGYTCTELPIVFVATDICGFDIEGSSKVCVSSFGCQDLY